MKTSVDEDPLRCGDGLEEKETRNMSLTCRDTLVGLVFTTWTRGTAGDTADPDHTRWSLQLTCTSDVFVVLVRRAIRLSPRRTIAR